MQPAQTLAESDQLLDLTQLDLTSQLYADLTLARGSRALGKLEIFLRNAATAPGAFAKVAFVGNRGSGKSTFLRHLESELESAGLFTALHLELDKKLESDCSYSDLLLWMVDGIATEFEARGHPVDATELSKVAFWFAETIIEKDEVLKKEVGLESELALSSALGIPQVVSLKFLLRLKSMISGSQESRRKIRQSIQNRASELRDRVNDFLEHARDVLHKAGRPARLLIVQDNLDRLSRENGRQLFELGGDLLTELSADFIYTAPLALSLTPFNLQRVFHHLFKMHNVKVRQRDGSLFAPGIAGLVDLIGRRMSLDRLFDDLSVVHYLAEHSGGRISDLLLLLAEAQLEAQADGKTSIDRAAAGYAVRSLGNSLHDHLFPGSVYYPILAEIHREQREYNLIPGEPTHERVAEAQKFFSDLITMGAVLEYNGDGSWYDVHPALCDHPRFQDACRAATRP